MVSTCLIFSTPFTRSIPAVEINLIQDGTLELIGGVRDGSIDLAFVALGTHPVDDLEARVIDAGADGAGMRTGSSPGSQVGIQLTELAGESFIDFISHWGSRDQADRMLAEAGVHRSVALQVNDVHLLLNLVGRGLGIAVVPKHFEQKTNNVRFRPIADTGQWQTALIAQHTDRRSRAGEALLELTFA